MPQEKFPQSPRPDNSSIPQERPSASPEGSLNLQPHNLALKTLLGSSENPPVFSEVYFTAKEGGDSYFTKRHRLYRIYKGDNGKFILMNGDTRRGIVLSDGDMAKGWLISGEEFEYEAGKTGKVFWIDAIPPRPSDPKELAKWQEREDKLRTKFLERGQ